MMIARIAPRVNHYCVFFRKYSQSIAWLCYTATLCQPPAQSLSCRFWLKGLEPLLAWTKRGREPGPDRWCPRPSYCRNEPSCRDWMTQNGSAPNSGWRCMNAFSSRPWPGASEFVMPTISMKSGWRKRIDSPCARPSTRYSRVRNCCWWTASAFASWACGPIASSKATRRSAALPRRPSSPK